MKIRIFQLADTLIWAVGREPNVANANIQATGVRLRSEDGTVAVDAMQVKGNSYLTVANNTNLNLFYS